MGTDAVRTWEGEGEVGRREGAEKEVGGSCGVEAGGRCWQGVRGSVTRIRSLGAELVGAKRRPEQLMLISADGRRDQHVGPHSATLSYSGMETINLSAPIPCLRNILYTKGLKDKSVNLRHRFTLRLLQKILHVFENPALVKVGENIPLCNRIFVLKECF